MSDDTKRSDWLSTLNRCSDVSYSIALRIGRLAAAASCLGNEGLASQLREIAASADELGPAIQRASIAVSDEGLRQARRSTQTLLEGVLAGVTIGKREEGR